MNKETVKSLKKHKENFEILLDEFTSLGELEKKAGEEYDGEKLLEIACMLEAVILRYIDDLLTKQKYKDIGFL